MTDPKDPPRPRLYRVRDESVWALIRQRYLSGETQKTLALAYDVPVCTIQKRISREGWSKRAAIGVRPTFGGMAAPRDFELVPPQARWPEAYAAAVPPGPGAGETWTSWKETPPESLREGPRPLPGLWHYPKRVWSPPPGYGPMPPHLVPPRPAPPAPAPEDEADPPSAAPLSAGEAAEQAVAAAGRAVGAGRYGEAERLGRLAATLTKLAGQGSPAEGPARAAASDAEDEDLSELPETDRPVTCTLNTCRLDALRKRVMARMSVVFGSALKLDDVADVTAWTDMMEGLGAPIEDEDLRRLVAILKTEGPGNAHRLIDTVVGRPPPADVIDNSFPPAADA